MYGISRLSLDLRRSSVFGNSSRGVIAVEARSVAVFGEEKQHTLSSSTV